MSAGFSKKTQKTPEREIKKALKMITMQKKNKITDYSAVLDQKYGKPGTEERNAFDEEAYAFILGRFCWMLVRKQK